MAESIHIDRLLTNLATRYMVENDIGEFVSPAVKVKRSSDKYAAYDKSSFRIYDNKIAGREEAKEISADVGEENYSCEEYALARFVSDRKRENADSPINLEQDAVRNVKEAMLIAREKRVAAIANSQSLITQNATPTNKWNAVSSGTPVADIREGMKTVWTGSTKMANSIVVPIDVSIEMIGTDEYRDYFKYNGLAGNEQFNIISGLGHLGLEPKLVGVFAGSSNQGGASDPAIEPIWGENVLIFHRQARPNLETRTFMYSPFRTKDRVTVEVLKKQRGRSYEVYEDIDELLIDAKAAYLLYNTLA